MGNLEKVNMPSTITEIGKFAFSCTSVKNLDFIGSVTKIDNYAFSGCSALKINKLPSSVTYLGDGAFSHTDFTTFTMSKNVTYCGKEIFSQSKLEVLTFEFGVEKIFDHAFEYSKSLTTVMINKGIKEIGEYAFSVCKSLENVTLVQLYSAQSATLTDEQLTNGDVNKDGYVNIFDETEIQLMLARF